MPMEIQTVYTKERLLRFYRFTAMRRKWMLVLMVVATVIVGLSCLLILALGEPLGRCGFYLAMILLLDGLYLFMTFVLPHLTVRKAKNLNTVVKYSFEIDSFTAEAKNDYVDEKTTVRYALIQKGIACGNELYLMVNFMTAYVVDLSSLSQEDTLWLKNILETNLSSKKVRWTI